MAEKMKKKLISIYKLREEMDKLISHTESDLLQFIEISKNMIDTIGYQAYKNIELSKIRRTNPSFISSITEQLLLTSIVSEDIIFFQAVFNYIGSETVAERYHIFGVFSTLATRGYVRACVALACYYRFINVPLKTITLLYEKAAELDYPYAKYELAEIYRKTEKSPQQSFELYKMAADQGVAEAGVQVGLCYEYARDNVVHKDISKAIEYYAKAAQNESHDAIYRISELFRLQSINKKHLELFIKPYLQFIEKDKFYKLDNDEYKLFEENIRQIYEAVNDGLAKFLLQESRLLCIAYIKLCIKKVANVPDELIKVIQDLAVQEDKPKSNENIKNEYQRNLAKQSGIGGRSC